MIKPERSESVDLSLLNGTKRFEMKRSKLVKGTAYNCSYVVMTFLLITETMSVLEHMNDEGGLQLPFVKKILKLNTRKSQSNASEFVN